MANIFLKSYPNCCIAKANALQDKNVSYSSIIIKSTLKKTFTLKIFLG
jgi:hypothetical protein